MHTQFDNAFTSAGLEQQQLHQQIRCVITTAAPTQHSLPAGAE